MMIVVTFLMQFSLCSKLWVLVFFGGFFAGLATLVGLQAFGVYVLLRRLNRKNQQVQAKLCDDSSYKDLDPHQSLDFAYNRKVHSFMCLTLKKLVDRISEIYSSIESARPRCSAGLNALCQLQVAMDKAKLLIQHCSESSKLYLISGIIEDLRGTEFHLESSEDEAGKVISALLRQDIPASYTLNNSEFEALQFAAVRLKITSIVDVLVEKRSIKRILDKVCNTDPRKKKILKYLSYLLKKYGELIGRSRIEGNRTQNGVDGHTTWDETPADNSYPPEPPEEFKCPLSMRLMYDPVIIASGKTYERVWIERLFNEGHETCPISRMRLDNLSLTPNIALKSLISKWCSKHNIIVSDPCAKAMCAPISTQKLLSSNSIASIASSMDNLCLQVSGVSLQSLDTNYGSDVGDNDNKVGFCDAAASLSELASLPWVSQCKAVEDAKEQLKKTEKACDWMFPSSSPKQLIKFWINAHDLCDVKAQKDSAEVLLEILSKNRTEMTSFDEDVFYVFASFLDSNITREALAILDAISCQKVYQSGIMASGILPSILKVLDTQIKEFHELAIKILSNLSCNINVAYHILYLDCLPKLVAFLDDRNLAGYCLNVINNLCNIEEGRRAAAQTNSCISSIARLLQTGTKQEQETALEVLLSLCYDNVVCHQLITDENFFQTLFFISVNENSRSKVLSVELFHLLGHVIDGDGNSNTNSGLTNDTSSNSGNHSKGKKSSSKAFGNVRRKISKFFRHSH